LKAFSTLQCLSFALINSSGGGHLPLLLAAQIPANPEARNAKKFRKNTYPSEKKHFSHVTKNWHDICHLGIAINTPVIRDPGDQHVVQ
jgi:hypothetical protein